MGAKYNVVLKGIGTNAEAATVTQNLAALFKCSTEHVKAILANPTYTVKSGVTQELATRYQKAVEGTGAVCVVEPEAVEKERLNFDLAGAPAPTQVAAVSKKTASDEIVLFQGDASLIKSYLNVVQGSAVGTNQKFVFSGGRSGDIVLRRADILSAEEGKHGFSVKWVVKTVTGETYQFLAANAPALRQTMLTLSGEQVLPQSAHKEPELSAVRNTTAWLAAFGPTLSGLLAISISWVMGWNWENATTFQAVKILVFYKLPIIFMFLRIDHLMLQKQGFNTVKLGIVSPMEFPMYLFSRAKAFGHGKGYAITWCVLFALEALPLIF